MWLSLTFTVLLFVIVFGFPIPINRGLTKQKSHFEPMYTEPLSQCGDFCDKNGLVMSLDYLKELHQRL